MIIVKKNYSNPPPILKSDNCRNKVQKALAQKKEHNFSSHYYGHEQVRTRLEKIYHNKCAYCETNVESGATLQVEHYRPKKGVTEDKKHDGYYWLGYEWSNLLLACPKCNGKSGKSNQFPIEGVRVYAHKEDSNAQLDNRQCHPDSPPLSLEKPLLLNPEINEPKLHFKFQFDGEMIGVTNKGKKTIEICRLNREELKIARQRILDKFLGELKEVLLAYELKIIDSTGLKYFIKKILQKSNTCNHLKIFSLCLDGIYTKSMNFFCKSISDNNRKTKISQTGFSSI
jgi:uncharacterized protein (TIGR02646 family)